MRASYCLSIAGAQWRVKDKNNLKGGGTVSHLAGFVPVAKANLSASSVIVRGIHSVVDARVGVALNRVGQRTVAPNIRNGHVCATRKEQGANNSNSFNQFLFFLLLISIQSLCWRMYKIYPPSWLLRQCILCQSDHELGL